jgi:hypothetical protein
MEDNYIYYLCFKNSRYVNYTCVPYRTMEAADHLAKQLCNNDDKIETILMPVNIYIPNVLHGRLIHNKLAKKKIKVNIMNPSYFEDKTTSDR